MFLYNIYMIKTMSKKKFSEEFNLVALEKYEFKKGQVKQNLVHLLALGLSRLLYLSAKKFRFEGSFRRNKTVNFYPNRNLLVSVCGEV